MEETQAESPKGQESLSSKWPGRPYSREKLVCSWSGQGPQGETCSRALCAGSCMLVVLCPWVHGPRYTYKEGSWTCIM